nr:immunoglobulin heavy chain junction region [Macaca mulatta]MOV39999.1 immunoglobulin heavy chain junction region [Macaca mulatta]MOV43750.1 immunoglobulin heavy chain junction region [Macaca mulatta]MOV45682.1 immunoglobulin heavy chain junction region [Macaca mulatta]
CAGIFGLVRVDYW